MSVMDGRPHGVHNLSSHSPFYASSTTKLSCLKTATQGCEQLARSCYDAWPNRRAQVVIRRPVVAQPQHAIPPIYYRANETRRPDIHNKPIMHLID